MKKILAIVAFVLVGVASYAQWSAGPNNVWLLTTGNVGVGLTNPSADLHVNDASGTASLVLNSTAVPSTAGPSTNLAQYDMRFNGVSGSYYRNVLRKNNVNGNIEMLQTLVHGGNTLNFMFVDLVTKKFEMQAGIEVAEFKNNGDVFFNNNISGGTGRVGIGTTGIATGVKLQVGGKVKCQEVEVAVTPWPDHVFKTGYNLMSLNEVEAFINANSHLPGVPSEAEVAENGVNIGKMNATLLQKVEELTLYMIDLKKENDALKARVSNLEK
jgi:hypothetical protein